MSTDTRTAGKRGARAGNAHPELRLSNFKTTAPTPPPTGDVTSGITAWGMDGNDQYGCCGPAATDHYQVAKLGDTSLIGKLGGVGPVPLYFEYGIAQGEPGPQPDQGVDNDLWLQFLFNKGIIEAFAELDFTNVDEVHQAMLDYRGVLISVELTDDAEQLFNSKQPWTLANGESPDPNEGHDILLVKYGPEGDTFVTWGALQLSTIPWDNSCITSAWVIITSEDAERTGVDIAALQNQIRAWGGKVDTTTPPAPAPTPAPTPAPVVPADPWWVRFWNWLREGF